MTDFTSQTVRALLQAFASPDPLPGGGSAAALTASLGTSLLLMVAGMNRTRTGEASDAAVLAGAVARLRPCRDHLMALIDEDSRAYQALIDAYRASRETEDERTARAAAIQRAVRWAVDVPLRTMRLCEEALREVSAIVASGNPNAVTDARVGATLLIAALDSAGLNIDVNLPGVKDPEYVRAVQGERAALAGRAREYVSESGGTSATTGCC